MTCHGEIRDCPPFLELTEDAVITSDNQTSVRVVQMQQSQTKQSNSWIVAIAGCMVGMTSVMIAGFAKRQFETKHPTHVQLLDDA